MHTARQLSEEQFEVRIGGEPASRAALLPDWTPWDRFGIVVDRPLGALGASALIQLAITAFYDARPGRRAGYPVPGTPADDAAVYPDIYLFHVGGRHGFHAPFDFWPARKEVFLPADPRQVLDAVNDRGITRLAVPDAAAQPVEHQWKEPAAARDRIVSAFAYSPEGVTAEADVEIIGLDRVTQVNVAAMLAQGERDLKSGTFTADLDRIAHDADLVERHWTSHKRRRAGETAGADTDRARAARSELGVDGRITETYRRIGVDEALDRLTGAQPVRIGAEPSRGR